MQPAEMREAIAAAIYFYQSVPAPWQERIAAREKPLRVFEPREAMAQWIAWVQAAETRGLMASVDQHRAAADRVLRMLAFLSGYGLPPDMLDHLRAMLAKPVGKLPEPAEADVPVPGMA